MRWKLRPTKGLGSTDADRSLSAGKKLSFQVVRMGNTIWCKEQKPGWFMANHPGLLYYFSAEGCKAAFNNRPLCG